MLLAVYLLQHLGLLQHITTIDLFRSITTSLDHYEIFWFLLQLVNAILLRISSTSGFIVGIRVDSFQTNLVHRSLEMWAGRATGGHSVQFLT